MAGRSWEGLAMSDHITIRQATQDDLVAVRALCWDYRTGLLRIAGDRRDVVEADYSQRQFETIMDSLPQLHARPDGAIFAGDVEGSALGCAMTHRIDAQSCEIKRLFVDPAARGKGLAERLVTSAMRQARADGYTRMVLDSLIWLEDALRLYDRLGFAPCPPYYPLQPAFADLLVFRAIKL